MERTNTTTPAAFSKPSKRRKYLGEADDPHFVPSSPIISRQSFTLEQEEELTRSCTIALSTVQHSDDESEDPLMKYVTNHLVPKQTRVTRPKDRPVFSKPSACLKIDTNPKTQKSRPRTEDTASPSTASARETIDRTETSTPLTFLSDSVRKSTSTRQSNALRSESKASQHQTISNYLSKSRSSSRQREANIASRSMIALAASKETLELPAVSVVSGKFGLISISQVEFNKSLPTLPQYGANAQSDKPATGVSHLLRTARKTPDADKTLGSGSDNIVRSRTVPLADTTKKHRFNLASLFNRRKKQRPTETTAS